MDNKFNIDFYLNPEKKNNCPFCGGKGYIERPSGDFCCGEFQTGTECRRCRRLLISQGTVRVTCEHCNGTGKI